MIKGMKKKKKGERGCKLAPERRGIKMAFPKGCANLDKLYSGFSSSSGSLPPFPSLSSPRGRKGKTAKSLREESSRGKYLFDIFF